MSSIQADIIGEGTLESALGRAVKQFPHSTEAILKKEATNIAKDLKIRAKEEAEGHHYGGSENPLAESFQRGGVVRRGSAYAIAVTSKAPHYHLYELGHDMVPHYRKRKRKKKAGFGKEKSREKSKKTVGGRVKGKKTVARYMAKRAEHSSLIGEELLNEILKDAGL